VAWCYCWDAHGAPEEGVEIHIRAARGGGGGNAYTVAAAIAVSDGNGVAAVEIPRDATLEFIATRGRRGVSARFQGVDADSLELPAILGRP
jgi:hypothetical protein